MIKYSGVWDANGRRHTMKKLFFVLLTALSAAFVFNCGVYADDGAASRNIHGSNYIKYGVVVSSDLYENGSGLERVEFIDKKVVIEKYSLDGEFVSAIKEIPAPLPLYGGFGNSQIIRDLGGVYIRVHRL